MKVIGLTGGIGSGKSAASAEFEREGIPVVDADVVSHALTAKHGLAIPTLKAVFGNQAINSDGAMDRNFMRSLVFSDKNERKKLEKILHPLIQRECLRQILSLNTPFCILSVPLLTESGFWRDHLDRILLIDAPEEVQIQRVMNRSHLSQEEVKRIIAAQMPRPQRIRIADDIIVNDGTIEMLRSAVLKAIRVYYKL